MLVWLLGEVEVELPTLAEHQSSPSVFRGVRVTQSLVLCVMFCRSFFCLLCCLSFELRILINPLVSSNSSYNATGKWLIDWCLTISVIKTKVLSIIDRIWNIFHLKLSSRILNSVHQTKGDFKIHKDKRYCSFGSLIVKNCVFF